MWAIRAGVTVAKRRHTTLRMLIAVTAMLLTSTIPRLSEGGIVQEWKVADGGNGHVYELIVVDYAITWTSARDAAAAATYAGSTGHLASVTSSAEDSFLKATFAPYIGDPNTNVPGVYAWIGLSDAATEGNYQWTTGEAFTYSNWAPPEPNNLGDEDFVFVWQRKFTGTSIDPNGTVTWSWNDSRDDGIFEEFSSGYFIEYEGPFAATSVPEPSALRIFAVGIIFLMSSGAVRKSRPRCEVKNVDWLP